jgi:MOSC domain-containing protein YiiM
MRLVSVNVGVPNGIGSSRGGAVVSAIFKRPVQGPVIARRLNLEGDRQADLTVHGGEDKAVYAYPSEHYDYWKHEFPLMDMPWGTFGENLTTEGLLEEQVHVGDSFVMGSARFAVTKPRFPCFKLGLRFEAKTMVRSFLESERTGFYLKVIREGLIEAGGVISRAKTNPDSETIAAIVRKVKREE